VKVRMGGSTRGGSAGNSRRAAFALVAPEQASAPRRARVTIKVRRDSSLVSATTPRKDPEREVAP
jgi:hypothetical protein